MLTACFDASGKPEQRCIVVAGFCSFSAVWDEFHHRWEERLERDGLRCFHAVEFAHSTKTFASGWKGNEIRRRSLVKDLMDIIRDCGLRRFGCIVRIHDFEQRKEAVLEQIPGIQPLHAYAFAAMQCVEAVGKFARAEGVTDDVRFVFEKGDAEDHLRALLKHYGYQEPEFLWATPTMDRKGVTGSHFVGLQAADWLAYEYYGDADNLLYSQPKKRWPVDEFESLPGRMTLVHHGPLFPSVPELKGRIG